MQGYRVVKCPDCLTYVSPDGGGVFIAVGIVENGWWGHDVHNRAFKVFFAFVIIPTTFKFLYLTS